MDDTTFDVQDDVIIRGESTFDVQDGVVMRKGETTFDVQDDVVMRKPGKRIRNTETMTLTYFKHFFAFMDEQPVKTTEDMTRVINQAKDATMHEYHPDKVIIPLNQGAHSMCLSKSFFE